MKIIHDPAIFEVEKGTCWRHTPSFVGYGCGYPEEVELRNFSGLITASAVSAPCVVEHMLTCTAHARYYQRRTRQTRQFAAFYIRKGEMYFRSNDRILLAGPGDCVLLHPHRQNDFLHLPGKSCIYYEIVLSGTAIEEMIRLYDLEHVLWFRIPETRFFGETDRRLALLEKESKDPLTIHRLAGIAVETLQLFSFLSRNASLPPVAEQIRDILEQHLEKEIKMAEVAGMAGVASHELNGIFKESFGVTPYHYLKNRRLGHSAELLRKGASVKEAATLIGYSNAKSFATEFLRVFGVTPREYRGRRKERAIHPADQPPATPEEPCHETEP